MDPTSTNPTLQLRYFDGTVSAAEQRRESNGYQRYYRHLIGATEDAN
ncbi:MAG: hypothetical protein WAN38_14545 [Terriglobales bacterium]